MSKPSMRYLMGFIASIYPLIHLMMGLLMSKGRPLIDEEIDLLAFIETLWDGKWKIVGAIILSVLSVAGYQFVQPSQNFEVSGIVQSISTNEAEKYRKLNALNFFEVTPRLLNKLYIEQLHNRSIYEEAIRGVLDPEEFDNELAYNTAVIGFTSSAEIIEPPLVLKADGSLIEDRNYKDTFFFSFRDMEGWKQVMSSVDLQVNLAVQSLLQEQFETLIFIKKQERDFALEDNISKIENAMSDYEKKITDKLAYLSEQASIARSVGIAQNVIDAEMPVDQEKLVVNFGKNDTPFYLRGYTAIEKEIELIKSRENKRSFTEKLFELENEQRALKQDKSIERAELLFASTPIVSDEDFSAGSLYYNERDFIPKNKRKRTILLIAAVLGGSVGIVFVSLSTAIRNRKVKLAEA